MSMFLLLYISQILWSFTNALQPDMNVSTDTDVEWKWGSVLWGHIPPDHVFNAFSLGAIIGYFWCTIWHPTLELLLETTKKKSCYCLPVSSTQRWHEISAPDLRPVLSAMNAIQAPWLHSSCWVGAPVRETMHRRPKMAQPPFVAECLGIGRAVCCLCCYGHSLNLL